MMLIKLNFQEPPSFHRENFKYDLFHSLRTIWKKFHRISKITVVFLYLNLFKIAGKVFTILEPFFKHLLIEGEFFSFIQPPKTCQNLIIIFFYYCSMWEKCSLSLLDLNQFYDIFMNLFRQYWFIYC